MHLYIFLIFSLIYSSQSEYYDETDDVHEDYEFPYSNKKSTISAADHLKNINEITTPQLHTQKETTEGDYDDRSEIYPDSEEISEEEEEEEEEEGDDADYEHSTIEILGPTRSALNLTTKRETTQSMEHEPVLEGSAENIRQGQAKLNRDRLLLKIFLFSSIIGLTALTIGLLVIHFRRKQLRYQGYKLSNDPSNQHNNKV